MLDVAQTIAQEFAINKWQVDSLAAMLYEGNTLPFIARYRKEQHGALDDQLLRKIADRLAALRALEKRRADILASLEGLGLLDPELTAALLDATSQS